jgi:hypothetical protein
MAEKKKLRVFYRAAGHVPLWKVMAGEYDATFVRAVEQLRAKAIGARVTEMPTMEAIQNVFALAVRGHPEIREFNPLILWNLHYLREIDDSGYIDRLYQ